MIKSVLIGFGGLFLGMLAMLSITNLIHGGTESSARIYGDWRLSCPPTSAKVSACTLTQDVVQNGNGTTLVHIEIAQPKSETRIAIVVPHGVLLQPGLGLELGSAPLKVLKYQTCDQVGCVVVEQLDQATIDAIGDAEAGRIVVVSRDGQQAAFPLSLKEFRSGMRAVAWESFKRGSWLGRQLP